jgi:predicted nucleic acid-binding protein
MSILLDTNIMLRSVEPNHPMHNIADAAVGTLLGNQETIVLVSQNLYEFWVVGTRPTAQNGLGFTSAQAQAELNRFKNQFNVYDDTPAVRTTWEQLVAKYGVIGKNAHDARLVAAMVVHGVKTLLTFNVADFQRFQEINATSPADVVQSAVKGSNP